MMLMNVPYEVERLFELGVIQHQNQQQNIWNCHQTFHENDKQWMAYKYNFIYFMHFQKVTFYEKNMTVVIKVKETIKLISTNEY